MNLATCTISSEYVQHKQAANIQKHEQELSINNVLLPPVEDCSYRNWRKDCSLYVKLYVTNSFARSIPTYIKNQGVLPEDHPHERIDVTYIFMMISEFVHAPTTVFQILWIVPARIIGMS